MPYNNDYNRNIAAQINYINKRYIAMCDATGQGTINYRVGMDDSGFVGSGKGSKRFKVDEYESDSDESVESVDSVEGHTSDKSSSALLKQGGCSSCHGGAILGLQAGTVLGGPKVAKKTHRELVTKSSLGAPLDEMKLTEAVKVIDTAINKPTPAELMKQKQEAQKQSPAQAGAPIAGMPPPPMSGSGNAVIGGTALGLTYPYSFGTNMPPPNLYYVPSNKSKLTNAIRPPEGSVYKAGKFVSVRDNGDFGSFTFRHDTSSESESDYETSSEEEEQTGGYCNSTPAPMVGQGKKEEINPMSNPNLMLKNLREGDGQDQAFQFRVIFEKCMNAALRCDDEEEKEKYLKLADKARQIVELHDMEGGGLLGAIFKGAKAVAKATSKGAKAAAKGVAKTASKVGKVGRMAVKKGAKAIKQGVKKLDAGDVLDMASTGYHLYNAFSQPQEEAPVEEEYDEEDYEQEYGEEEAPEEEKKEEEPEEEEDIYGNKKSTSTTKKPVSGFASAQEQKTVGAPQNGPAWLKDTRAITETQQASKPLTVVKGYNIYSEHPEKDFIQYYEDEFGDFKGKPIFDIIEELEDQGLEGEDIQQLLSQSQGVLQAAASKGISKSLLTGFKPDTDIGVKNASNVGCMDAYNNIADAKETVQKETRPVRQNNLYFATGAGKKGKKTGIKPAPTKRMNKLKERLSDIQETEKLVKEGFDIMREMRDKKQLEKIGKSTKKGGFFKETVKATRGVQTEVKPVAQMNASYMAGLGKPKRTRKTKAQMEGSDMSGMGKKKKEGGAKKPNKRAEIVKKIMKEKGMKMIEASKYVKANNLY